MKTSLLNSCALVIDNEITDPASSVSKIVAKLEAEGTLFIKCGALPAKNTYANLSGISFIILDWKMEAEGVASLPAGIQLGSSLGDTGINSNIDFIKAVLGSYFVPIFVFSKENVESIENKLRTDEEIRSMLNRRVFVKAKDDLTGDKVKRYLRNWLKENRTFFALKIFDEKLSKSKNTFLVEVGKLDSEWANIVYNTIKLDHLDENGEPMHYLLNAEFRDFLTNSLLGRMSNMDFEEVQFRKKLKNPREDTNRVFESIKFYKYGDDIDNGQAFEGDLYQKYSGGQPRNEYLINVNAPCDLRKGKILFLSGKTKQKYRQDVKAVDSFFQLPCFAGAAAIEFRFDDRYRILKPEDLSIIRISEDGQGEKVFNRIGRITAPYITVIRNEFAHFISRQGLPRHPKQHALRSSD